MSHHHRASACLLAARISGGAAGRQSTSRHRSVADRTRKRSATFLVEAKRSGTPTGLLLASLRERASATDLPLLFVSDHIGPSLRQALTAEGISYADATGWAHITSDVPLILLTGRGQQKSPRAGKPTAVVRLNGVAASRIIRTLCAEKSPLGVRELAAIADVSPGSVSKLLPTLASEGIIDRDQRGVVVAVRRRALIKRWARDYSFAKTNASVGYFISPRGLDRTLSRLTDLSAPVTLTGSAAARRTAARGHHSGGGVAPARALYQRLEHAGRRVGSHPCRANYCEHCPGGSPRWRCSPLISRPWRSVLADLLTLPGRSDAEAEQLMEALARTDEEWKA